MRTRRRSRHDAFYQSGRGYVVRKSGDHKGPPTEGEHEIALLFRFGSSSACTLSSHCPGHNGVLSLPIRSPSSMKVCILLALAGLAVLSGCTSDSGNPAQPSFYASMADAGATVDAAAAASMISGYRGNNGLGAVEVDPDLMRMAMDHARVMAAKDKVDRSAGREFTGRLTTAGFDGKVAVENVGAGYHTLAEAFSGWRDSPPHRANMLKSGVNRLGIAAVYAPQSKYKVFWALIMAAKNEGRG